MDMSVESTYDYEHDFGGLIGFNHLSGLIDNVSVMGSLDFQKINMGSGVVLHNEGVIRDLDATLEINCTNCNYLGGAVYSNTGHIDSVIYDTTITYSNNYILIFYFIGCPKKYH